MEILTDYSSLINISQTTQKKINKQLTKFSTKREFSSKIADSFDRRKNHIQAELIRNCGNYLTFGVREQEHKVKLVNGNFCKNKFCSMCNYRRTLKLSVANYKIIEKAKELLQEEKIENAKLVFLTLTVPNVNDEELKYTIKRLQKSINRFFSSRPIKKLFIGCIKTLEITRNKENGTYHPHFHLLAYVNQYMPTSWYVKKWTKSYYGENKEHQNVCYIEKVKDDKNNKSIKEISKYAVKEVDFLNATNDKIDKNIETLEKALHHIRLISYTGIFKRAKQILNIDEDNLNDDLTEEEQEKGFDYLLHYQAIGLKNYELIRIE